MLCHISKNKKNLVTQCYFLYKRGRTKMWLAIMHNDKFGKEHCCHAYPPFKPTMRPSK